MGNKEAARWQPGGGCESGAGGANPRREHSTRWRQRQGAPTAFDRPHVRGPAIYLGDRPCGIVEGGVFVRGFDTARNTLAWGRALAYRCDLLRLLEREGVVTLAARDKATGDSYDIPLARFLKVAEPLLIPRYGDQLAVDLREWRRTPAPVEPRQLGLFEPARPREPGGGGAPTAMDRPHPRGATP